MKPYFERDGLALFLGDCREIMPELGERMDPGACQLAFTSPPYNISLRMKNGQYAKRKRGDDNFSAKYTHFDDALLPAEYYALLHDSLVEMLKIAPTIFLNMQIATGNKQSLFQIIGEFGGFIKDLIIWDKGSGAPAIQENTLNRCYELLFVLERDGQLGRSFSHSHFPKGTMNDIWRFGRSEKVSADNAAVFPEELVALAIENWTTPNAVVLDPFCGTGTTLLAALNCGREGIGIDISDNNIPQLQNNAIPNYRNSIICLLTMLETPHWWGMAQVAVGALVQLAYSVTVYVIKNSQATK